MRAVCFAASRNMLEELMDDDDEVKELNLSSRPRREERRRKREREKLERELDRWTCTLGWKVLCMNGQAV